MWENPLSYVSILMILLRSAKIHGAKMQMALETIIP